MIGSQNWKVQRRSSSSVVQAQGKGSSDVCKLFSSALSVLAQSPGSVFVLFIQVATGCWRLPVYLLYSQHSQWTEHNSFPGTTAEFLDYPWLEDLGPVPISEPITYIMIVNYIACSSLSQVSPGAERVKNG